MKTVDYDLSNRCISERISSSMKYLKSIVISFAESKGMRNHPIESYSNEPDGAVLQDEQRF
jgi:hypothetical protein